MTELEQKLSEALMRVCELDGVFTYPDEDSVCIQAGHLNNYLVAGYLARLIESGDMEIKIRPSKISYLMKLLKVEKYVPDIQF